MNPSTGHLVKELNMVPSDLRQNYEPIPTDLERAAAAKLAGQEEAMVSLTSGGKLSRWAAGKRKKNRMAKESRRKNRG